MNIKFIWQKLTLFIHIVHMARTSKMRAYTAVVAVVVVVEARIEMVEMHIAVMVVKEARSAVMVEAHALRLFFRSSWADNSASFEEFLFASSGLLSEILLSRSLLYRILLSDIFLSQSFLSYILAKIMTYHNIVSYMLYIHTHNTHTYNFIMCVGVFIQNAFYMCIYAFTNICNMLHVL